MVFDDVHIVIQVDVLSDKFPFLVQTSFEFDVEIVEELTVANCEEWRCVTYCSAITCDM